MASGQDQGAQGSKFKDQSSKFQDQGSKFKDQGSKFQDQGTKFQGPEGSAQPPVSTARPEQAGKRASLLVDSVSISSVESVKVDTTHLEADVKPLEQEDLERYWREAAVELELEELMGNATVRVGEHHGRFEVDAQTTYFADEFKPHKIEVLEAIRKRTGMRLLDCRVNPMFVEQTEKAYSPEDKYKVMMERNARIASMRHLFPEIDY